MSMSSSERVKFAETRFLPILMHKNIEVVAKTMATLMESECKPNIWFPLLTSYFLFSSCLAAYAPDEVTDLPGIPHDAPPFKQYSGYLNATGDKRLHYWFVESQSNPSTDPLLLWLNGGPGCSSLDGFLSEIGPFHVNNDGATLYYNEYTWNRQANVIFLESPVGVGFSYSPTMDIKTNDMKVAVDNFLALQHFFAKFPTYLNNSFFITGESYGGVYIPTLAIQIMNSNTSIKLEGFAIGNGLLNATTNMNSAIYFAYYHALLDKDLWIKLQTNCCQNGKCDFFNSTNPKCETAWDVANEIIQNYGINTYSIYRDCAGGIPVQLERYHIDLRTALGLDFKMASRSNGKIQENITYSSNHYTSHGFSGMNDDMLPCIDAKAETTYLSREDVRFALHIPAVVQPWTICSHAVEGNYTKQYRSVEAQFSTLLMKYRALVYNGDVDIVCNFLGDQWFVRNLNHLEIAPRRAWLVNKQVAGFVDEFKNVTYATIKGAGHMVPQWKPAQAYYMITQFLNNQPL